MPRSEDARALARTLGLWTIALWAWSVLRLIGLHRYDEFGLPPWLSGLWVCVCAIGVATGVAQFTLRPWGRRVYALVLFVALVAMTHVEDAHAPGRFWTHIIGHLVLAWWLWSPAVTHALEPEALLEAPAKIARSTTAHVVLGAAVLVDFLYLVREIGAL